MKDKRKNWKKALVFIGAIGASVVAILGASKASNREAEEYSPEWFEKQSLDTLEEKREEVRKAYCVSGLNEDKHVGVALRSLLGIFDNWISIKKHGDTAEQPWSPPVQRENGWYL